MFQFPRFLSLELCIHSRISGCYTRCVPTFGYPRIVAYLQLPEAFRSSSRPSSASIAKASSMRPFLFNHLFSLFDEFEILIIYSFLNRFTLFFSSLSSFQRTISLFEKSYDLSKPSNKNFFLQLLLEATLFTLWPP